MCIWNKHETLQKFIHLQVMPIWWHTHCEISVNLQLYNIPSAELIVFSIKFDFWQKSVIYKLKKLKILSKLRKSEPKVSLPKHKSFTTRISNLRYRVLIKLIRGNYVWLHTVEFPRDCQPFSTCARYHKSTASTEDTFMYSVHA